ncbi:MAG: heme-copper oxidase subunit III [Chloroflexi bacterium]|nr:heme-copper oxidase subunit III [Chloroflexota bacterium]
MSATASHDTYNMEQDHRKLGIWVFLASEVIFFGAVITTFVVFRDRSTSGPNPHEVLTLLVPTIMTLILLTSSITMVLALQAIQNGNRTRMWQLLVTTAALGLVFLALKANEYSHLISEGVTPSTNIFGSVYFLTTGLHAAHVLVGIIWIFAVAAKALRGGFSATNYLPVEIAGLYWHFVDLIWVAIFMVVYLTEQLRFV